jgi:hypothetical protein
LELFVHALGLGELPLQGRDVGTDVSTGKLVCQRITLDLEIGNRCDGARVPVGVKANTAVAAIRQSDLSGTGSW